MRIILRILLLIASLMSSHAVLAYQEIFTEYFYFEGLKYYVHRDEKTAEIWECPTTNKRDTITIPSIAIDPHLGGKYPVTRINGNPFCASSVIKEIRVEDGNEYFSSVDGVLYNRDVTYLIAWPAGKEAESIDLPESVTSIGESAFRNCDVLTRLMLPNSVTEVGDYAFSNCSNLTDIVLPDSQPNFGKMVFSYCENLTDIVLPESMTTIGEQFFSHCSGLKHIKFPDNLEVIGKSAFEYCTSLTELDLSDTYLVEIGDYTFFHCENLKDISWSESLQSIGDEAFWSTGIEELRFPDSVTEIGDAAFWYCDSLKSVILPYNLTVLETSFYRCEALEYLYIPPMLEKIIDSSYFPSFDGSRKLVNIEVDEANPYFCAEDGMVLSKDGEDLYLYPSASGDIVIRDGIKRIMTNCLWGRSVYLPPTIEYISGWAFFECYMESITIAATLPPAGNIGPWIYSDMTGKHGVIHIPIYVPAESIDLYCDAYPERANDFLPIIDDSSVDAIEAQTEGGDVYNIQGVCIKHNATPEEIISMPSGLYIIGGKKVFIR